MKVRTGRIPHFWPEMRRGKKCGKALKVVWMLRNGTL